jgi:hypothetical protein
MPATLCCEIIPESAKRLAAASAASKCQPPTLSKYTSIPGGRLQHSLGQIFGSLVVDDLVNTDLLEKRAFVGASELARDAQDCARKKYIRAHSLPTSQRGVSPPRRWAALSHGTEDHHHRTETAALVRLPRPGAVLRRGNEQALAPMVLGAILRACSKLTDRLPLEWCKNGRVGVFVRPYVLILR